MTVASPVHGPRDGSVHMTDPHDYEFQHLDAGLDPEEPRNSRGKLIALALAFVVAASVAYLVFRRQPAPAPAATAPVAVQSPEPPRSLGGEAEAMTLPPLDETDAVVRMLVGALSSHPVVAAWLATDGLIRGFTVAAVNIADGNSPGKQLKALRPSARFLVVDRKGMLFVDPRSYTRYGPSAAAVASIDPAGAAKLYATLKPRIEDAAGELGIQPGQFDRVLERAIIALLRTPIPR